MVLQLAEPLEVLETIVANVVVPADLELMELAATREVPATLVADVVAASIGRGMSELSKISGYDDAITLSWLPWQQQHLEGSPSS